MLKWIVKIEIDKYVERNRKECDGEIERQKYVKRKSNEWDTEIGTEEWEIETERKMCQKIRKEWERDVSNKRVRNQRHMGKEIRRKKS